VQEQGRNTNCRSVGGGASGNVSNLQIENKIILIDMNAINEQTRGLNHHNDVANLARQIWQSEGGQQGRDQEYWLKAERQILAARQQKSRPASQVNEAGAQRNTPAASRKKSGKN
jgi:hypothetical protein